MPKLPIYKNIKDCTFKDFEEYCNLRACDGKWDFYTAKLCLDIIREIYKIKPLFRRKKARERKWQECKEIYFNQDAVLELS